MKTLLDLYKNHDGKVSDKWSLYLREYDKLFEPYREKKISMLEIGVQNGGSLEIWAKYFKNAEKFIGCDINPSCDRLIYKDSRIEIIIGDATTPETKAQILRRSAAFDLIIEDGSHNSSDIIKAFSNYFPALRDGGIFVAEDLHCSYWGEYQGGIHYPYSSISFFKLLVDIINHEHWGVERRRLDLISEFNEIYDVNMSEELLSQIGCVHFFNSMCIIEKRESRNNELGRRHVAGSDADIFPIIATLNNTLSEASAEGGNFWSTMIKSPAANYLTILEEKSQLESKISELNQQIKGLEETISWRVTAPFRVIARIFKAGSKR